MEEHKQFSHTFFWEVPEIDLDLRHYSGQPSDVIKKIKSDIEHYLSNPNLVENHTATRYSNNSASCIVAYNVREIYSAIYNALNYYKNISYLPSAEYETGSTFLSSSISTFNKDYEYLSQKYSSDDITQEPVISVSGRIKSPLSFMEKVKEKIVEYIDEDRDFRYFNESLRDLIGVRFVINPPQEVQAEGLQAESDFLYKVYYDLMDRHGITYPTDLPLKKGLYRFFPVNTRHDPQKLAKMKARPDKEGFAPYVQNGVKGFFRPTHRIPEIEQECVDSVTKDYNFYAKYKGYQSIHTCVIPYYSQDVEQMLIPSCIIPPACKDSFIEYQFRTSKQNDYAEHGPVSHNTEYKPTGSYHRLAVPFYIEFDSPDNIAEAYYDHSHHHKKPLNYKNKLKLRNFGESFKKFYGPTFEEYFGIPFKRFRDVFGSQDRNDILAKRKIVIYDEERDLYTTQDVDSPKQNPISLALTPEEILSLRQILANQDSGELAKFFSKQHLQDAIIQVVCSPEASSICSQVTSRAPGIKLYTLDIEHSHTKTHSEFESEDKQKVDIQIPVVSQGASLDDDL